MFVKFFNMLRIKRLRFATRCTLIFESSGNRRERNAYYLTRSVWAAEIMTSGDVRARDCDEGTARRHELEVGARVVVDAFA